MSTLRNKCPDRAVPTLGLVEALDFVIDVDGGLRTAGRVKPIKCPGCEDSVYFSKSRYGFHARCYGRCGWSGSLFDYFCGVSELKPAAALEVLRKKRVQIPKGTSSPAVLQFYQKYLASRKAFRDLERVMNSRELKHADSLEVHATIGLTKCPHVHDYWWTTTPAEIGEYLDGRTDSESVSVRRLGATDDALYNTPTVAIPAYDQYGDVVAISAFCPGMEDVRYETRSALAAESGVYFRSGLYSDAVPSLGKYAILLSESELIHGLALHAQRRMTVGGEIPLVVCRGRPTSAPLVSWEGDWLVSSHVDLGLARRLNAEICTDTLTVSVIEDLLNKKTSWETGSGLLAEKYVGTPWRMADMGAAIGWCPEIRARVAKHWRPSVLEAMDSAMKPTTAHPQIRLDHRTTIVETEQGWTDAVTNKVLALAIPVNVFPHQVGRAVYYRGHVLYKTVLYPFDSRRFRKDAPAVVESTLLKAGITGIPQPHPSVAARMAHIALYLSRLKSLDSSMEAAEA